MHACAHLRGEGEQVAAGGGDEAAVGHHAVSADDDLGKGERRREALRGEEGGGE